MKISFETKYEPYQHLWMLDNGVIKEVVPTALAYHGDKRGVDKELWKKDYTHVTYQTDDRWIDERKLFPTKDALIYSLASNAISIEV